MKKKANDSLAEIIRKRSCPLQPHESGMEPKIRRAGNVEAVLFDVYGTLFISGSGDIGTARESAHKDAFEKALSRSGAGYNQGAGEEGVAELHRLIEQTHHHKRRSGTEFPEVNIMLLWEQVLKRLYDSNKLCSLPGKSFIRRMAVEYECAVNPVWPMPGARDVIREIAKRKTVLGIISNAQFYTPMLFQAFFGCSISELGFSPSICLWSWKAGCSKPSTRLHRRAAEKLQDVFGIAPSQSLYVGNDMLNDMYPAFATGFKTALFAGDRRSLRLRSGDRRCRNISPDLVLTDLNLLPDLL